MEVATNKLWETDNEIKGSDKNQKTEYACVVEAHESTSMRFERTLPKDHEDHIAEKGFKSLSHHNFGAQVCSSAASDDNFGSGSSGGQWEELGKSPAWQVSKVRRPKEIILENTEKRMAKSTLPR